MAKNKRNSFRKNPIEDIADMKKQEAGVKDQSSTLSSIDNKLDNIQAIGELGAEVSERGFSTLNDTVGNKLSENTATLDDLVAGSELIADITSIQGRKLNKTSNIISNKLSNIYKVLSSGMAQKANSNTEPAQPQEPTTEESVSGTLPVPQPEPPQPPDPINDNRPRRGDEEGEGRKIPRKRERRDNDPNRGNRNKIFEEGFKSLQKNGDTIAKLLFDITVTSALNVAKTVMMIGAIILVADILRMKFQYFNKLMETNFKQFNEKLGKFAPIVEKILTGIDSVNKVLEGNFSAEQIAITIAKSIGGILKSAISTIGLMISKGLAGLLRALPFDWSKNAADSVEGQGLYEYQSETNATLTGRDARLAAVTQDSHDRDDRQRDNMENGYTPDGERTNHSNPNFTPETAPDYDKISDPDKRYNIIEKMMNLMAESKNDTDHISNSSNPNGDNSSLIKAMQTSVTSVNNDYTELQKLSPDAAKRAKPSVDQLNSAYQGLSEKSNPKVSPDNPKNSPTYTQEKNIGNMTILPKENASNSGNGGASNVGVTNIKNVSNNHVYTFEPRTSSPAPGMRECFRVA